MPEKNDGTIVIHLPSDKRLQFKRLYEMRGFKNSSEYGRYIVEKHLDEARAEYEFMKSIFETDD